MDVLPSLFRFSLLMLFVPVLLLGLAGTAVTLYGLLRRRALMAWPTVSARVLATEVECHDYRGLLGRKERAWDLEIEYQYEAGGNGYRARTSMEVSLPKRGGADPEVVEDAVAKARGDLGDTLLVHVDPKDGSRTLLPMAEDRFALLRLLIFLAATVVSACALGYVFLN